MRRNAFVLAGSISLLLGAVAFGHTDPTETGAPTVGETASPDGAVLSEVALRKILADTCDKVNAFYKAEHFPMPAPPAAGCNFSYSYFPSIDPFPWKSWKVQTGKFERSYTSALSSEMPCFVGKNYFLF